MTGNMLTLGDALRQARELKGVTLDQAQKQTRINSTILKALEEGKIDNILNPTYAKSFLKKYTDFLELDSNHILAEYKRLHPDIEPKVIHSVPEAKAPSRDMSQAIVILKIAATLLIAVVVIALIGGRIAAYLKRQVGAKPAVVTSRIARPPSVKQKPAKKKTKRSLPAKKEASIAIPKNVQLKLLLKVNKTVLVKMKTDGNLLFERVLPKGAAEIFTADHAINVYVAKGESIEFILNGKSLGSPGKGLLKNVEITRSGVKIK